MHVRDLGALTVGVDAVERQVTGTKVPSILAMLVIHINKRVSADGLIDAAWGDRVTAGASSTLLSHIWRLRQLLEPTRESRQTPTVLINDDGGYKLIGSPHSVDSLHFEQLASDVRDLLAAGRGSEAARRADDALALWRGRPYGDLAEKAWASSAVARLDEVRGQLLERRIEALLAADELDTALSDLNPLIADMPFREPLWGLKMLALYRSGRSEEALSTYRRVREVLIDGIGAEPGAPLQEMQRKILARDASLTPPVQIRLAQPARTVEIHLPATLTGLIGRDYDRSKLVELLSLRQSTTITGPAGCGKTRLAIDVARAVAEQYPDGVWFVDLTTVTDPEQVAELVTSTIGFVPSPASTPLEQVRSYLSTRRVLLVLDNCEHVLGAVNMLVEVAFSEGDASVGSSLLATSREPLGFAGETIWTLQPLGLPAAGDVVDGEPAPALDLFLRRLRAAAPTLELDESVMRLASDICVSVDGLPLALELAAARIRVYPLEEIARQVGSDPSQLSRPAHAALDHRSTIRSAIEWSYRMLTPAQQLAHRRLSVLPGRFTHEAALAVVGSADPDGPDVLADLVHRSLLMSDGAQRAGGRTSFTQLATVRAHARHALTQAGESTQTVQRRNNWIANLLDSRPSLGHADEVAYFQKLDDCYPIVRMTLADMLSDPVDPLGGRLAARLGFYWYYRARMVEGERYLSLARAAVRDGDPVDSLLTAMALASALAVQGRIDLARPLIHEVLDEVRAVPSNRLTEAVEGLVAAATAMWVRDEYELTVRLYRELDVLGQRADDQDVAVVVDAVGCLASFAAGRVEESVAAAHEVYARGSARKNLLAMWISAGAPMVAALMAEKPDDGIPWVGRILQNHVPFGVGAVGNFVEARANFGVQSHDWVRATQLYAAANVHTRRAGMLWPRRSLTTVLMARAQSHLSPDDYACAWQDGERLTVAELLDFG